MKSKKGTIANNNLLFCKAAFLFLHRSTGGQTPEPQASPWLLLGTGCAGSTRTSAGHREPGRSRGRTQKVGVTLSDGLPCRPPSGPALGRDAVSAPGKAQRKPRCVRAEAALALALHWSTVMGNAPNAALPRGDPRPRPSGMLRYC